MSSESTISSSANTRISIRFDAQKALEAILFVAHRVGDPGFHRISKILYFADREHLSQYGRLICGDSYVAMKLGPVPSRTYDILKCVRGDRERCEIEGASDAFQVRNGKYVKPTREADLSMLSKSDIKCLNESIKEYGDLPFDILTDVSHDQAWKSAGENNIIDIEQIVKTLSDSEELLAHLKEG